MLNQCKLHEKLTIKVAPVNTPVSVVFISFDSPQRRICDFSNPHKNALQANVKVSPKIRILLVAEKQRYFTIFEEGWNDDYSTLF